jgi:hypothetical protein
MPGVTPGNVSSPPPLRLLPGESGARGPRFGGSAGAHPREDRRPALRLVGDRSPLLIAGAEESSRAALLDELTLTMPSGTSFAQASTLAEVLEGAPGSRMVILSSALEDVSASSLMRILGQRHPRLPVVCLGPTDPGDL